MAEFLCEFIGRNIQKFVLFVFVSVLRVSSSTFWFLRPLCATWWHSRALYKCSLESQNVQNFDELDHQKFCLEQKRRGFLSNGVGQNFLIWWVFFCFLNLFVFQLRIIGSCQKLVFRLNKTLYENLLLVLGNFNNTWLDQNKSHRRSFRNSFFE